jgi:hypothetical protein
VCNFRHGPHSAGACRALFVEAVFIHRCQPGRKACTCPIPNFVDMEQQQQHILTPASAKAAPAQRRARHCSVCGAARHTHAHTYTHIHSHACARAHTYKHKRARMHTRAHTYTRTNTQAHTHTCTHMHMHTHVARVMGFSNFSASLATLPHLPLSHTLPFAAQVWDVHTLECFKTLEGHDDNVRVLAVGDRYMFSGSWDKSIRVRAGRTVDFYCLLCCAWLFCK